MQFSTVPSASFRSWQRENENDTSQDGIPYRSGKSPPIARLISELKQRDSHSLPPVDKSPESEHEAFRVAGASDTALRLMLTKALDHNDRITPVWRQPAK
jgi:hypothetical protein